MPAPCYSDASYIASKEVQFREANFCKWTPRCLVAAPRSLSLFPVPRPFIVAPRNVDERRPPTSDLESLLAHAHTLCVRSFLSQNLYISIRRRCVTRDTRYTSRCSDSVSSGKLRLDRGRTGHYLIIVWYTICLLTLPEKSFQPRGGSEGKNSSYGRSSVGVPRASRFNLSGRGIARGESEIETSDASYSRIDIEK